MAMATVYYVLSPEGQKKDLKGENPTKMKGTGRQLQEFRVNLEGKDIDLCEVGSNGNLRLCVGCYVNRDDGKLSHYNSDNPIISYRLKIGYDDVPVIEPIKEMKSWDHVPNIDELLKWEHERVKNITDKKTKIQSEYDKAYEQFKISAEVKKIQIKEQLEKNQALEDSKKKQKERKEQEMKDWINEFGDERLKLCVKHGYICTKDYLRKRAEIEFPGFFLDYDETAKYKDKISPCLEYLKYIEKLKEKGYDAEIVYLKEIPDYHDELDLYNEHLSIYGEDADKFDLETVVIHNYLGYEDKDLIMVYPITSEDYK